MSEAAVLNPSEFIPELEELDLDSLGLAVRAEGVDYGEAQITAQMVRQSQGEASVDGHRPPVQIRVPIRVHEEGAVTLAEAAHKLQATIGRWQDEGGWFRRGFAAEGRFAGSIAYKIIANTAQLSGLQGWLWANRRDAPDVVLTAMRQPIAYATVETVSATFTETTNRELIFELASVLGSAPGLIRVTVTNDNASDDWRGAILAIESRDHPQDATKDTTAALAYEAEDLTPVGGAAIATRTNASGGASNNVIRHTDLSNSWQAILSSQILATKAHMTHVGVRRIWARIYDPGATAGEVELRLEWRALGQPRWSRNAIVPTPLGGFALVDLGECRPDAATLGDQRWEWRITARTTGTAGADIEIDKVWPLPTEQYVKLRQPLEVVTPTDFEGRDEFNQSAGDLTGKTAAVGGTYVELTGSDATDFTIDTTNHVAERIAVSDTGNIDSVTKTFHGRAVGLNLNLGATVFSMDVTTDEDTGGYLRLGQIVRAATANDFLLIYFAYSPSLGGWLLRIFKIIGGSYTGIYGSNALVPIPTTGNIAFRMATVVEGNRANVFVAPAGSEHFTLVGGVRNSALGTTLSNGDIYIYDENLGTSALKRTYDNLAVWVPEAIAVCSASRSIEFRSDGVYRQHLTADVWGQVTAEGFLPYAPPSGLEARAARAVIIPTQADFDVLDDSGTNRMSAIVSYFAGYLYSREAA